MKFGTANVSVDEKTPKKKQNKWIMVEFRQLEEF